MALINPQRVQEIYDACHVTLSASAQGLVSEAVESYREEIQSMLDSLPDEFRKSKGGGMSLLNGCRDRNGDLWTGMQGTVVALFALGQALGKVTMPLPRPLWGVLPGGVPYYTIED